MAEAQARPGQVVMTERIRATPEQVWDYLVRPEKIVRWMGREARVDPTPGGEFWLDVTGDDVASGSYVEVERPHRVVFTWGWEGSSEVPPGSSTVSFTLTADGDGTLVELVHDGLPGDQEDRHAEGWTYYFDRFVRAAVNAPIVVSRDEWLTQRIALLADEKAHQRARDALAAHRRALPWVLVDQEYTFETEHGLRSLPDLFDGRSQLITYHFMYGPDWDEGCPSCSFWADSVSGTLAHLAHRDTSYVHVSNAPLDELLRYRARMGWDIPWVSCGGTTFQADFGLAGAHTYNYVEQEQPNDESPGLSVFVLRDGQVFHTYSTYARGLDPFNSTYALLDMTAKGRDEDDLPWTMAWLRRHDAYDD